MDAAADTDNIAWVRDLWALRCESHTMAAYLNSTARKAQIGYGPLSATRRGSGWSS